MRRVIWILVGLAAIVILVLMITIPAGRSTLSFLPAWA